MAKTFRLVSSDEINTGGQRAGLQGLHGLRHLVLSAYVDPVSVFVWGDMDVQALESCMRGYLWLVPIGVSVCVLVVDSGRVR